MGAYYFDLDMMIDSVFFLVKKRKCILTDENINIRTKYVMLTAKYEHLVILRKHLVGMII